MGARYVMGQYRSPFFVPTVNGKPQWDAGLYRIQAEAIGVAGALLKTSAQAAGAKKVYVATARRAGEQLEGGA